MNSLRIRDRAKRVGYVLWCLAVTTMPTGAMFESLPGEPREQEQSQVKRLAEDQTPALASASDMDWLAGRWQGTGLGGTCEEMWMPASAGSMVGAFRFIKDDELQFYEFLAIVESEGSLVLRVKHFDREVVGWEERDQSVDFPLVELKDRQAFFSGLTMRREADRLDVFLAMTNKDGKRWEEHFRFQKVD